MNILGKLFKGNTKDEDKSEKSEKSVDNEVTEVDEDRSIIIIDEAFRFGEHQALYDTCMSLKYSPANTSNFDIQDIADSNNSLRS